MNSSQKRMVVIGGGAAGFFGALVCAGLDPSLEVIILEKTRQPLSKVRVSGGGRCNVTHHCFDPRLLAKNYPRGEPMLKGAFFTFQPQNMMQWLEERGVSLKVEADGRVFPVSNNSQTIISCFQQEAKTLNVQVRLECEVVKLEKKEDHFDLLLKNEEILPCRKVLLATGGMHKSYALAEGVGHTAVAPVPSLFTFNIVDPRLEGLSGVSLKKVGVKIEGTSLEEEGPLLITHWGLSGPAILRLSAWGARILSEKSYKATLLVNWIPDLTEQKVRESLLEEKQRSLQKTLITTSLFELPKNLWRKLVISSDIPETRLWAHLSKEELFRLLQTLLRSAFQVEGKSLYKEEFVTCGGIPLEEIQTKTMESKKCPGLYFAGEVMNVDGITGGFNFQNAWTTAWIAAHAMVQS